MGIKKGKIVSSIEFKILQVVNATEEVVKEVIIT